MTIYMYIQMVINIVDHCSITGWWPSIYHVFFCPAIMFLILASRIIRAVLLPWLRRYTTAQGRRNPAAESSEQNQPVAVCWESFSKCADNEQISRFCQEMS